MLNGSGPGGGALACPSALNPTSSWWAVVTIQPCQVRHGWGLGEVKSGGCDPRISMVLADLSWRRALELATDSREAPSWQGAR
jgi:hypothetical protein